jgi:pyrimidine-nucleoside phosphorylase/thymidine phosphorylase
MKSVDEARELAGTMVDIGKSLGRKTVAVVTDMSQPLGHEVGNANEIMEVIEILKGHGAQDETQIALTIASHMAVLGEACPDLNTAFKTLEDIIRSGKAIEKLKEFVRIQGGNPDVIDNPGLLPQAKYHVEIMAQTGGFVSAIDAEKIGIAAMLLGAGRKTKEDKIDFAAGITMKKKVGDTVVEGEPLCVLHTNLTEVFEAEAAAAGAFSFSDTKPAPIRFIHDVISDEDYQHGI